MIWKYFCLVEKKSFEPTTWKCRRRSKAPLQIFNHRLINQKISFQSREKCRSQSGKGDLESISVSPAGDVQTHVSQFLSLGPPSTYTWLSDLFGWLDGEKFTPNELQSAIRPTAFRPLSNRLLSRHEAHSRPSNDGKTGLVCEAVSRLLAHRSPGWLMGKWYALDPRYVGELELQKN